MQTCWKETLELRLLKDVARGCVNGDTKGGTRHIRMRFSCVRERR